MKKSAISKTNPPSTTTETAKKQLLLRILTIIKIKFPTYGISSKRNASRLASKGLEAHPRLNPNFSLTFPTLNS